MRRAGESIYIGGNIVVTLVSVDRNRARIGIEAPRSIVVDRAEVAERKRSETVPPRDTLETPVETSSDPAPSEPMPFTDIVFAEAASQAAPYQRPTTAFTPPKRRQMPRRKK
jgi:carbon storage regulator